MTEDVKFEIQKAKSIVWQYYRHNDTEDVMFKIQKISLSTV